MSEPHYVDSHDASFHLLPLFLSSLSSPLSGAAEQAPTAPIRFGRALEEKMVTKKKGSRRQKGQFVVQGSRVVVVVMIFGGNESGFTGKESPKG